MKWLATLLFATSLFASAQRDVKPGAAGPNRLDVDVALLSRASADLRDLRIVDASGAEVPYLLIEPSSREPQWIEGQILPVATTRKTSGFEADFARAQELDRIRFTGIAAPFLKRVRIEGSGDRARWTLLADATVFDLPDEKLRSLEVAFAHGAYRYLRVTWDDRSSAPVAVSRVDARLHASGAAPAALRAPLPFRKRASEPGKSRYRVELPGPRLPLEAIEVRVSSGNVFRTASITEPRLGNGEVVSGPLGGGTLRRAERAGAVAEELAIRIERPSGRELDLVIEDGNNPPLPIAQVVAVFVPQPWIYFESEDATPLVARYGDARLQAPRYDLEASRRYVAATNVAVASWGPAATPSSQSTAPANNAAMELGAEVDRDAFRVLRPIPPAAAGLALLQLDADVLARSNDLADVRIVTSGGRQVPYLVEQRDEPLVVPLKVAKEGSVHRIELPYAKLPFGTTLVLRTTARVFERSVTLRIPEGATIHTATWRASDPELEPPALTLPVASARVLEVVIADGDNAPLPIASASLMMQSAALRFHHPGTPLFLLYGNARAQRPRYDLALLAPRLFGEPAREIQLAAVAASPDEAPRERKLFWLVIVAAAVALLAMLARILLPREKPVSEP